MLEALNSTEMSFVTRGTWRNIPEDGILHSDSHENIKSYLLKKYILEKYVKITQ
jgi:hypothetical protein